MEPIKVEIWKNRGRDLTVYELYPLELARTTPSEYQLVEATRNEEPYIWNAQGAEEGVHWEYCRKSASNKANGIQFCIRRNR